MPKGSPATAARRSSDCFSSTPRVAASSSSVQSASAPANFRNRTSFRTRASPARLRSGSGSAKARRSSATEDSRMALDIEIDVQLLKSEIKKTYASVSEQPEQDFIFPTGRAWAEDLAYPAELAKVPETAVESFAGVANPWTLGRLTPGERVLDLGSGAGTD